MNRPTPRFRDALETLARHRVELEDGYLAFEIQNRSKNPYHLASVRVLADGRVVVGRAGAAT